MAAGIALLLLLAPEDPAQMMKVAWASQYEWKEDGVQSATIEFTYAHTWGEKGEFSRKGTGHVVVVGDAIVRGHYPEVTHPDVRAILNAHIHWVMGRFVHKPFEEFYKDMKFSGPEKSAYDQWKIMVNDRAFFVKGDRFEAWEMDIGTPEKPHVVRVEGKPADLGGGYAILGEFYSYTSPSDSLKVIRERTLTTGTVDDRPTPASYVYEEKSAKSKERLAIEFSSVKFDRPEPVVLDPKARDVLKEAWGRRFVLPEEIRISGQFQRTVDKELDRSRWASDAQGDFQVYGMDNVQITLDEGAEETLRQCEKDIRWIFGLLRDTPFETEFPGCGFELEPAGEETVVRVYGYPKALAFRVANGVIVGHYNRELSELGWWTYKTKSSGEGRHQIDRMKREIEGTKVEVAFDYQRVRGHQIPRKFGVFNTAQSVRGTMTMGIAEYVFKRPKVSFPDE